MFKKCITLDIGCWSFFQKEQKCETPSSSIGGGSLPPLPEVEDMRPTSMGLSNDNVTAEADDDASIDDVNGVDMSIDSVTQAEPAGLVVRGSCALCIVHGTWHIMWPTAV